MAMRVLGSDDGPPAPGMPQMAPAAWAKTVLVTVFRLARSATDVIMVMSLAPTNSLTSMDAMLETMSFGSPMGNDRMMAVQMCIPVPPPMPTTPSKPEEP